MSKSIKSAKSSAAIKVATTLGKFKFRGSPEAGRVVVTCRDLGKIRMKRLSDASWEAVTVPATTSRLGIETVAIGKNAKQCYKNALTSFWM